MEDDQSLYSEIEVQAAEDETETQNHSNISTYFNNAGSSTENTPETKDEGTDEIPLNQSYEQNEIRDQKLVPTHVEKRILVEKDPQRKPFLGGFINHKTNLEFHHASTQTPPPPKSPERIRVCY
jgi:hypothetical protein